MSKARGLADLGNAFDDGALSNRNLIINGAMQVAQRGTSFTGQTGSDYFIDRFRVVQADDAVWTYSQETDAPAGFANSFKALVTTVDAANDTSDYQFIRYSFEGQDLQQLKKGTPDAESVTLSFWVKCSNAGTFISELNDADNNRTISRSYTINAANTWEYKTVTFDGDTTGSLDKDNAESLRVHWWYAAGSEYTSGTLATSWQSRTNADRAAGSTVNIPTISGGYFQITGVQLEVGDTATPFEHRSYGDELARCQRYYCRYVGDGSNFGPAFTGCFNNTTECIFVHKHTVPMRAAATLGFSATSDFDIEPFDEAPTSISLFSHSGPDFISIKAIPPSGRTQGFSAFLCLDTTGYIEFDAEL